jgi:hypothetical protein
MEISIFVYLSYTYLPSVERKSFMVTSFKLKNQEKDNFGPLFHSFSTSFLPFLTFVISIRHFAHKIRNGASL